MHKRGLEESMHNNNPCHGRQWKMKEGMKTDKQAWYGTTQRSHKL